ncbi:MAG: carboxypeptidase regulatory-like domain-containing protein [Roseburia sp.]|nr:carboxypeptidase regulatory-like domain-containing protein [Roseburia sp.]MBQ8518269.1 carboxypeptidase regulatory-like domain-containing protein [Agathobacter sp.]
MILEGYVKDKHDTPIDNAIVEIKGEDFITIYSTESNEEGYYKFDIPSGRYPFLIAVKDYAEKCLEYWCQNILLQNDMLLDVSFDTLEIYGLHVFSVKGGGNSLMAYFRPMSLIRFQQGEQDIAPKDITIKVTIDGKERRVINTNEVKEVAGEQEMSAYLIQVETTEKNMHWNKFDIEIKDKDGNYGAATIFNENI